MKNGELVLSRTIRSGKLPIR